MNLKKVIVIAEFPFISSSNLNLQNQMWHRKHRLFLQFCHPLDAAMPLFHRDLNYKAKLVQSKRGINTGFARYCL